MRDAAINLIKALSGQYGVDPDFALRIAKHESDFNQNAISPKGAIGVMQLMPDTAKGLGVNPYDLKGNITGGLMYLRQMAQKYPGRTDLQAAGYNAGPGAVDKWGGVPPFKETQQFVQNIHGDNTPIFSKPEVGMPKIENPLVDVASASLAGNPFDVSQFQSIVQAAAGQPRAPIPTGAVMPQNEVIPATSERGMELAQVLGALAGVAGPTYAKAGGAISELASGELDRARKNRAAQTAGYPTWEALTAAKGAAETAATEKMGTLYGIRALGEAGKAVETSADIAGKAIYDVTLPGSTTPLKMNAKQLMDSFAAGLHLQLQQQELGIKTPLIQAQTLHQLASASLAGEQANILREGAKNPELIHTAKFAETLVSEIGKRLQAQSTLMPAQRANPTDILTPQEKQSVIQMAPLLRKFPALKATSLYLFNLSGMVEPIPTTTKGVPGLTTPPTTRPPTTTTPLPFVQ